MLGKLQEDLKTAMKGGDRNRVNVLRMLISEFKNERIKKGSDLTQDDAISLLKTAVKKRKDAAALYREGGREDLAVNEEADIPVIGSYLPEQLSREETERIVTEIITESGALGIKDMGRVIGAFMAKYRSVADGSMVQEIVKGKLS